MEEKFTVKNAKNALYNEISSYYKKVEESKELKSKVGICKDILNILKLNLRDIFYQTEAIGLLLEIIYNELEAESIYKKIDFIVKNSAFTNDKVIIDNAKISLELIAQKIEDKKEELSLKYKKSSYELNAEKEIIQKYKYMLRNIKHDGYIWNSDKRAFVDLMHKYGATDVEIVEMFEWININYQNKKNNNIDPSRYRVINMLNNEYQPFQITEMDDFQYKEIYGPLINSIYDSLMKHGFDYIIYYLNNSFSNNTQIEEFDYVLKNVINKIIVSLQESVENIKDIEMYSELKDVIIKEYNTSLQNFMLLKTFFYKQREKYNTQEKNEVNDNIEEINRLIYLSNLSSTFLESDLKNIPEEFYTDVIKLLNNLKTGQLTEKNYKSFNGSKKLKFYRELRDDQLRILIRNIKENIYVVLGIFQKQDDNDLKGFLGRANRYNSNDYISAEKINALLEQSVESDERIYSFLKENARKGNR